MEKQKNPHFSFNTLDLLVFIYSKWKPILIITGIAGVISIIVALSITPKYQSSVVVFPASLNHFSKDILSALRDPKYSYYRLGEEIEGDQLLQILNSNEIKDKIISKFNLAEHWGLPTDKTYRTYLYQTYNGNVTVKRTRYLSVKIDVLDEDPAMAAKIANEIVYLSDSVYRKVRIQKLNEAMHAIGNEIQEHESVIQQLIGDLKSITTRGVNDYVSQAERFNEAYAQALVNGNFAGASRIKKEIDSMAVLGPDYIANEEMLIYHTEYKSFLYRKYKEIKIDLFADVSPVIVLDMAEPADVKATPHRTLLVVTATAATFLLTIIGLIVIESLRTLKINSL